MGTEQPVKYRHCPLCGADTVFIIKALRYALFDDSPLSPAYNLVSCKHCGLAFCDTPSTVADFYNHYRKNRHYLAENCGTGAAAENDHQRYASVWSVLQKYSSNKRAKLVDIGSAKGGLISFFRSKGYENLCGIDLLPECVDFIRAKGMAAELGSAEQLPIKDGDVDIIVLSHVLEHIVDLQTVLTELERVVKEGGLVYAEVPSLENGSSFKEAPLWDFLYEHINYFSTRHLIALFERRQFVCLERNPIAIHYSNGSVNCISAVFRKHGGTVHRFVPYINMHKTISHALNSPPRPELSELEKIIEERRPCYIWGVSSYMQFQILNTSVDDCNIISFLDNSPYKQTKTIGGIPINSPQLLRKALPNAVVIFPAVPDADSMNQYLDKISFSGKRILV